METNTLREYFEQGNPDSDDTISVTEMRQVLYQYAKTFGIELRIQEHLPGQQRVGFQVFQEYFLRNTTDAALFAYHPSGHLQWKSNLPETSLGEQDGLQFPSEMAPPTDEEYAVSMETALELLELLQTPNEITFADFLRSHNPDEEGLRTLNITI